MTAIKAALATLHKAALALHPGAQFASPFDDSFRSPAELSHDRDKVYWRPVAQNPAVDFRGLANAVEQPLHSDIITFYSSFWSGTIEAQSQEGHVSLIQLWNDEDFERLVANLLGHFMAQRRKKLPFTVFFANTEPDSELFLSIDNASGRVLLEEAGKAPLREVDSSLAAFLARLTAVRRAPALY